MNITPVCVYKISTYGVLCYCEILELENLPEEFEMSEIMFSDTLPEPLTFPESSQVFFDTVKEKMGF